MISEKSLVIKVTEVDNGFIVYHEPAETSYNQKWFKHVFASYDEMNKFVNKLVSEYVEPAVAS